MRRRRPRPGPEDSLLLRWVVLAAVMIAAVAVVEQNAVDPGTAAGTLILLPAGFAFSYVRRARRNTILKLFLAGAMFFTLGAFIQAVRAAPSVDDARVALAALFLWTQVLHSFDLPRRRDLAFSMVSSLILMAEAGSLSLGSGFALLLLPYAGLAGAWLYLSHRTDEERRAVAAAVRRDAARPRPPAARVRGLAGGVAGAGMAVVLAAGVMFVAIPRVQGVRIIAPPFSISRKVAVPGFTGGVVGPDLPSQQGGQSGSLSGGYPGFGDSVDLGVRWHLSDRVVMKVRAAQAAFWRAEAFDVFDGTTWTASDPETRFVGAVFGPPIALPRPGGAVETSLSQGIQTHELIQTFYVIAPQPNVVFAAYEPRDLYFPVDRVAVDDYASIRSPLFLEAGTIYSVISHIPVATPDELRAAPAPVVPPFGREFLSRYTQLPEDLSPRVRALAHRITDAAPTAYDKVMAVQAWLAANLRYNLSIPPDPPGADPLEEFLFHRRQGYCEHFSTAMVVLLRAVGIPARFAVGFGSGERNPLTGYFEVRESDAHSWVEVFYRGVGWMEYDPTHDVPEADQGLTTFLAPQVFGAVGRFLVRVVPDPVKAGAAAIASVLAGAWRSVPGGPFAAPIGVVAVAAAGLVVRRRRRRRHRPPPAPPAAEAFRTMCRAFERRGRPRPVHRTPHEHLLALLVEDPVARQARQDLELIVRAFEREAFSGARPDPAGGRDAGQAASRVRAMAGARPR